ncbi:Cas10/Cmr2 second palm domain-containing protein [Frankia tisae]|uniref:Cas10/Cmr2 second palm domain-containing protein n=1 Tax=Frankia tisae TaxID=2950104 RepID=UPI0021C09E25|nr:hypothetical protein [Frankia tisae]
MGSDSRRACFLAHLETSGNQKFITGTLKRRENVGASQVIFQLSSWVTRALRDRYADFEPSWRIDDGQPAQVVALAGGSASVVVTDEQVGIELITEVTRLALHEAPGLDVCGVLSPVFDWLSDGEVDESASDGRLRCPLALRARWARDHLADAREARPGPVTRFQRLPIVAECAASGLPARDIVRDGAGPRSFQPRSASSLAKRNHQIPGYQRLAAAAGLLAAAPDGRNGAAPDAKNDAVPAARNGAGAAAAGQRPQADLDHGTRLLMEISDRLGDTDDWVAVIHADGNNLGELFAHLDENLPDLRCSTYAAKLRALSEAVDTCTRNAFRTAFTVATELCPEQHKIDGRAPVLPLVLGGDDLTVLCLGQVALDFLAAYLTAFEEETATDKVITSMSGGLTACAGLAAVKAHYPYAAAYHLAEELTAEAKRLVKAYAPGGEPGAALPAGRPEVSAFSFHVVYDSGQVDLADLRSVTTFATAAPGGATGAVTSAVAQPYVTTPGAAERLDWVTGRHYDNLLRRVRTINRPQNEDSGVGGERALPSSQLHELRSAVLTGPEIAEARYAQLRRRYGPAGLDEFGLGDGALFFDLTSPPRGEAGASSLPARATGLLDAMNATALIATDTHTHTDTHTETDTKNDTDTRHNTEIAAVAGREVGR